MDVIHNKKQPNNNSNCEKYVVAKDVIHNKKQPNNNLIVIIIYLQIEYSNCI